MPRMLSERFEELAEELASRDRGLGRELGRLHEALRDLREQACAHIACFAAAVRKAGSPHLAQLCVDPLGPDEKHVDCLQFAVRRGRWELVCVGKPLAGRAASREASDGEAPCGAVTLVGPYRRGKPERPCEDHPLPSAAAERALAERLLELIRQASQR